MNYASTADIQVANEFATATYKSDEAGGSAWQLPESSPAHIFRKNPSDRTSNTSSTVKDDYFLEDPYETVGLDSGMDGTNAYHVSLAGVRGAWDFSRLAILAWPAALLAVWRLAAPRVPPLAGYALALVLLVFGVFYACRSMESGLTWQREMQGFLIDTVTHLDDDAPRWKTWR